MNAPDTRAQVVDVARRLFAERGYPRVTIRQIAAESGVSPAMVMKVGVSKEQLYADATPPESEPLDPDWPRERIGYELVSRVVARRDTGAAEPWLQGLMGALDSPDPAKARADFRQHYLAKLERRIGGGAPDATVAARAELVASMLIGLACAVRPLRLLNDELAWITERYGAMIQSVIDEPVQSD